MINREGYLKKIKSAMWDGNIKVITGLRRSGKSTLLFELFYNSLISSGVKEKKVIIQNDISHHYYDDRGFFHCNLLDFLMNRVELF